MANYNFDVLIVGTGISGLTTALKLSESGYSVGILCCDSDISQTNSHLAQGGIIYPTKDFNLLIEDIFRASNQTSSKEAAQVMAHKSGKILEELLIKKVKTDFEKDEKENLKLTKEAAHSTARIIYKGDYTGKAIQNSLLNYLQNKDKVSNITFLKAHTAIDLITPGHHGKTLTQRYEPHRVIGAYVYDQNQNEVHKIIAKKTVLATGGLGALYLHHTNTEGSRGDGHAMARRAGAILLNMEFIQFHPTTFHNATSHQRFLISEAVRGEGGRLMNGQGEFFMHKYHPDKELAPRDVVARSILEEMIATKSSYVFLDIASKDSKWIQDRFPTIYKHCLEKKIDITKNPIPVVPAAHYACGGIKVDLKGKTSVDNLYAVGEVACSGLHGANRLASTSLLEGLTWGYLVADDIIKTLPTETFYDSSKIRDWMNGSQRSNQALINQDWYTIKQTMWNYVGIIRTTDRLKRARAMFNQLSEEVHKFYQDSELTDSLIGLRNAIEMARIITESSIKGLKSVGCFYLKGNQKD